MCLYICGIRDFMNLDGLELVTAARQKRVLAYRQAEDRARSLAAGLLLRRFCGVTGDAQLDYGENGKPRLKDPGLHFNLSHSGDYVLLATSDNEVGADIEKISPKNWDGVAKRCFQPEERRWLLQEGGDEAFFYLWTAKESVAKALGLGLALDPRSFGVRPFSAAAHRIAGKEIFLDWRRHDGHIICRAVLNRPDAGGLSVVGPLDLL